MFLSCCDNVRFDLKTVQLKSLEEKFDKYIFQMNEELINAKKDIVNFILEAADSCLSVQALSDRDSLRIVCERVVGAFDANISTREFSLLLYKLHSGQLEREYQE